MNNREVATVLERPDWGLIALSIMTVMTIAGVLMMLLCSSLGVYMAATGITPHGMMCVADRVWMGFMAVECVFMGHGLVAMQRLLWQDRND